MSENSEVAKTSVAPPTPSNAIPVAAVSSHFKMVFISVCVFTGALFVANMLLSIFVSNPNENLTRFISVTATLMQAGFGAIIGLIGGKVA